MAPRASLQDSIPLPIIRAIDALIEQSAQVPLVYLFKRQFSSLGAKGEAVLRRNSAYALLTGACFDSSKEFPVFGGFDAPQVRGAIGILHVAYTSKTPEESSEELYNRRSDLYTLFSEKLTTRFGPEYTGSLPKKYDVAKLDTMRMHLFRMGYALQMGFMTDSEIRFPLPFKAVLEPLEEMDQGKEPTLPNAWASTDGEPVPEATRKQLFKHIRAIAFDPALKGTHIGSKKIVSAVQIGPPLSDSGGIPFRIKFEDGQEINVLSFPIQK